MGVSSPENTFRCELHVKNHQSIPEKQRSLFQNREKFLSYVGIGEALTAADSKINAACNYMQFLNNEKLVKQDYLTRGLQEKVQETKPKMCSTTAEMCTNMTAVKETQTDEDITVSLKHFKYEDLSETQKEMFPILADFARSVSIDEIETLKQTPHKLRELFVKLLVEWYRMAPRNHKNTFSRENFHDILEEFIVNPGFHDGSQMEHTELCLAESLRFMKDAKSLCVTTLENKIKELECILTKKEDDLKEGQNNLLKSLEEIKAAKQRHDEDLEELRCLESKTEETSARTKILEKTVIELEAQLKKKDETLIEKENILERTLDEINATKQHHDEDLEELRCLESQTEETSTRTKILEKTVIELEAQLKKKDEALIEKANNLERVLDENKIFLDRVDQLESEKSDLLSKLLSTQHKLYEEQKRQLVVEERANILEVIIGSAGGHIRVRWG